MLVQLLTNGDSGARTMFNVSSMKRGFPVKAETGNEHWINKIVKLQEFNRDVTEQDVFSEAQAAGASSIAKTLYQDYLNYRTETITNVAAMHQSEMSAMGRIAGISAQTAVAQDRMIQQFAAAGYQIGKSASYTQGIANAYASGLSAASNVM